METPGILVAGGFLCFTFSAHTHAMELTDINGRVVLNNGVEMPYLGLGVYKTKDGSEVKNAVHAALNKGYRLIDTASYYNNEEGVGEAIYESEIAREDIFVTSKVWNDDQGYEGTLKAFELSVKKLGFSYLDMYLIHWPVPYDLKGTWRAMEELYQAGKVRAIGMCNSIEHQVYTVLECATVQPAVLQNEFHPRLVQPKMLHYCKQHNIQYQAWAPLMRGRILDNPELELLARKYNKTVAQLLIRWDLQMGVCTIPKSVHAERIVANADVFNFKIEDEDVKSIAQMDRDERTGAHPDHFMEYFANKK